MKILRVGQRIKTGEKAGGGAYHLHALSRDQAKLGHDVTVVTIGDRVADSERTIRGDDWEYRHVECDRTGSLLGNELSIDLLRRVFDATDWDVIHLHSHMYFSTFATALSNWRSDVPIVITNHGLHSASLPAWVSTLQLRTMGWLTYSLSDDILCYTAADADALAQIGVSTPVDIVPNGVDVDRFSPDGPSHSAISTETTNVLFVGRLVERKRPDVVLRAFSSVDSAHLYFCGDGPMRSTLSSLAADLGVADRTQFLGNVDYAKMPSVYRASDLLVLPSETEGFPRTVLEALSCRVPAITTDLPQLRPVVSRAGAVIDEPNESALAPTLHRLLDDDEMRAQLAEDGRSLVEQRHTWDRLVSDTTAVMEQLSDRDRT